MKGKINNLCKNILSQAFGIEECQITTYFNGGCFMMFEDIKEARRIAKIINSKVFDLSNCYGNHYKVRITIGQIMRGFEV